MSLRVAAYSLVSHTVIDNTTRVQRLGQYYLPDRLQSDRLTLKGYAYLGFCLGS